MPLPARPLADGLELAVVVTPRAARTVATAVETDAQGQAWLHLRLAAPPVDGAANGALVRFLAEALDVAPSACRLVAGASGRRKRVRISGDPARLAGRLESFLREAGR